MSNKEPRFQIENMKYQVLGLSSSLACQISTHQGLYITLQLMLGAIQPDPIPTL